MPVADSPPVAAASSSPPRAFGAFGFPLVAAVSGARVSGASDSAASDSGSAVGSAAVRLPVAGFSPAAERLADSSPPSLPVVAWAGVGVLVPVADVRLPVRCSSTLAASGEAESPSEEGEEPRAWVDFGAGDADPAADRPFGVSVPPAWC
ncbi:hypothetical protein [Streptomyces sp. NPDC056468]|uniref:hypothetical protein n=1 Tax=Streptomyces sp. NPDC056468 TaxID=3345830 RepID=UPI0036947E09